MTATETTTKLTYAPYRIVSHNGHWRLATPGNALCDHRHRTYWTARRCAEQSGEHATTFGIRCSNGKWVSEIQVMIDDGDFVGVSPLDMDELYPVR